MKLTCVAALLALVLAPAHAAEPPVQITVTLDQMDGHSAMSVEMQFEGSEMGQTGLALPDQWGGEKQLYRAVRGLTAENAELSDSTQGPAIKILKHAPNASIKLKYRIVDDADGPPNKGGGNDYRIQLKADYIFALGNAWVVEPSSVASEAPAKVTFVTKPEALQFASDIEHQSMGHPLAFGDVVESVLLAGNIRKIDAGGGARLAIYGKIDARDDAGWRDAFSIVAGAQRKYWGAADEPYLVTVLTSPPVSEGSTSIGGTGRSDAFAFFATTNASASRVDQILAHEMMHTWVPRRLGQLRQGNDEALDYWLSEGFTDWTSWRVLARSHYWKPKDFAAAFNEAIKEYDLSPVREVPNARIGKDFWNDPNVDKLPYRRGMLLATFWDSKIRMATNGARDFDDVLLTLQSLATPGGGGNAVTMLPKAIASIAGLDISADLKTYVDQGRAVDLAKDQFAPCGDLVWIDRAKFHRGFDIEATQKNGNVIAGVVKGGPAEKAGLRDGMKLVKRSGGEIGNSQVEIAYDVIDGETPKTLSWVPEGSGRERFRQLKLDPNLTGERETACAQRLGGI